MAVLGRLLISSSERLDLPDLLSVDSYAAGDWAYFLKGLVGDSKPYILKGFDIIDPLNAIGTQSCSIRVADSMVFYPGSSAGSFYHGLQEGHAQATPLVPELRKNAVNYVYLTFSTFNASVDTRAFWDPDKDGGAGGEFTQDVNTESVLKVDVNVSVGSFPANTIPVALVTVGPVTITAIEDARDMMFRLGSGGINPDPFNGYAWRSLPGAGFTRTEPPTEMLAGGTNPFQGADKNILSLKEWMDAVMSKLRELGGTSYWYEDASTFSLISSFIDSNATAFRSKGKWSHSSVTAGAITWTEDINIKVTSDPRTYIVRNNLSPIVAKTLLDEQVMYIAMVRNGLLNGTDDAVDWVNAQPYINTVGGAVGLFANLAKGDYVKKINDSNDKYLRVEEFYDTVSLGGSTTTAANAKSIRLSGNYLGTSAIEKGRYDKGVYEPADVVISDRNQLAIQTAGGNFHWMATRSDTIQNVSNITPTTLTLAITEHDGATAKCTAGAAHGLIDNDRVTISGSTNFNGTYTVEVESATVFYINLPSGPFADEAGRIGKYAIVTTAVRLTANGLQLESANHGFASNDKIIITGTTDYNSSPNTLINVRSATTFQIPVSAVAPAVETAGTATLAKVIVRTEGSVVQVIQGGSSSIGGTPAENIRLYTGMESLSDTAPSYVIPPDYNTLDGMQNYNALSTDNLTVRAAKLTAMMADKAQDKTIKLLPSGYNAIVNTLNGASRDITFTATPPSGVPLLDIALPSSANNGSVGLTGTLSLLVNQAAYITIDRNASFSIANLAAVTVANIDDVPLSENILVLAVRLASSDVWLWDGLYVASGITPTPNLLGLVVEQNENLKLVRGGVWGWDLLTNTLSWTTAANVQIPNITEARNTIPTGSAVLASDGDVAYIEVNRSAGALTNLIVNISSISTLVPTLNTVIIARRLGNSVLVGNGTILLKDGEFLELDGALADINRRLTQLKLHKHETAVNKVRVLGADFTQLDQDILSQVIGEFILSFTGAVINFTTGVIKKEDDSTALGIDFTPYSIPVGEYYWYGVSLVPAAVLSDNRQEAQIQIDFADSSNAVQASAPLPVITGDIKLGTIQVQNIAGTITVVETRRLGVGSGSGGGAGDATLLETALRDYNNFAGTKYLDPNIFRLTKATKFDTTKTVTPGAFDPAKKAFKLDTIGKQFASTNLANSEFLAEGVDITDSHLIVSWLQGFVDTAASYELSRDGGTNWQSITMARVGTASNTYRGYKVFTDEVTQQSLQTVAVVTPGVGEALNAGNEQQLSSQIVLSTTSVITQIQLQLNRATSASTGNFKVQIIKDSGGSPSTALADLVAESNLVSIDTLGTGNITPTVDIPNTVLVAGTYHIVISTDAAYKAGTMNLIWVAGAASNGDKFNGTVWGSTSTKASLVQGRAHDLRVRVTSGTASVMYIEGMGLFFPSDEGMTQPNGTKNVQRFYFTGDENRTQFTLNWTPDPDLLDILDPYRGQVYAIEPGVAKISGQTVIFEPDTFDFPAEDIVLVFRQVKGVAIDNSDSNAVAISEQGSNLLDVGNQISELDYVSIPTMVVPNTTIVNRAAMPDLSQDLNANIAINRIMTQSIYKLQNEFGVGGEPVFGVVNDRLNQIRFVGNWSNGFDTTGIRPLSTTVGAYVEITFYGTGLNFITALGNDARSNVATVDGVGPSANLLPGATSSVVLNVRNYNPNNIIPVASGLTLGIHTVKLANDNVAGGINIYGFEILNESSTIQVNPGSQYVKGLKKTLATQQSFAYDTGFETGTLEISGGRVLVYQKSDGTIAKAVQPANTSPAYYTSANHANEEVVRIYNPREFGAGRTDDFSRIGTVSTNAAFTLDDGTTTLSGQNNRIQSNGFEEGVFQNGLNDSTTITFVGTGLDIVSATNSSTPNYIYSISVDGATIATGLTGAALSGKIIKVASGLPYGTHTVRITTTTASAIAWLMNSFIVYQPKTPALPTGAKAINAYNIMANFDGTTITGTTSADNWQMPIGTLLKAPVREFVYVGVNWAVSAFSAVLPLGFDTNTTINNNQPVAYTFYGTGAVLHLLSSGAGTYDFSVSIDSILFDNATGIARSNASNLGGGSYRSTSAVSGNPCRVEFSGLALGKHTIRLQRTAGTGNFDFVCANIITPIHSPKSNLYSDLQNTLPVGSQGIEDLRKIEPLEQITSRTTVVQAIAVTSSPTTTSLVAVPLPDMSVIYKSEGEWVDIDFQSTLYNSGANNATSMHIYINGISTGPIVTQQVSAVTVPATTVGGHVASYLPIGTHKIDIYWYVTAGTGTAQTFQRNLVVSKRGL